MSNQISPASQLTLEDMAEFFELTVEMISITGYDGYFKRLTPVWSRVLGYSIEELMAEPFINFVHPDDRAESLEVTARLIKEGVQLFSFKNRFRRKDGTYRTFSWTAAPSTKRQVLCAVARDVTESDREQERLVHLINSSRAVIYSLPVTPEGVSGCSFMSDNVIAQLGYPKSVFLEEGRAWLELVHPDDAARFAASFTILMKDGKQDIKYRVRHKDGSYRWLYDERKLLRDAEGKPTEVLGAWRDISDSIRDEELIRSQANALTELSTPLIPISDHVVVMPLIGAMDAQRVEQVLETLLSGVSARRASVAILDITGVSVVDAHVANALLQAARAVRLLGAEVVLTGIRPDVALTLVGLGLDLTGIVTKGTLQAGILHATRGEPLEPDQARPGDERLGAQLAFRSRLDRG
jgi:rsbT co-antagonist protein RsbR